MTLTWEDILQWEPLPMHELKEELRRFRKAISNEVDEVTEALTNIRSTGETAEVVKERLGGWQQSLSILASDLRTAEQAASAAVEGVRRVQRLVAEAVDLAEAHSYLMISSHGAISAAVGAPASDAGAVEEKMMALHELVRRALTEAAHVDEELQAALSGRPSPFGRQPVVPPRDPWPGRGMPVMPPEVTPMRPPNQTLLTGGVLPNTD